MKSLLILLLIGVLTAPGLPPSRVYVSMQSGSVRDTETLKWKVKLYKAGCRQIEVAQVAQQVVNVYCIDVELNGYRPDKISSTSNAGP